MRLAALSHRLQKDKMKESLQRGKLHHRCTREFSIYIYIHTYALKYSSCTNEFRAWFISGVGVSLSRELGLASYAASSRVEGLAPGSPGC